MASLVDLVLAGLDLGNGLGLVGVKGLQVEELARPVRPTVEGYQVGH